MVEARLATPGSVGTQPGRRTKGPQVLGCREWRSFHTMCRSHRPTTGVSGFGLGEDVVRGSGDDADSLSEWIVVRIAPGDVSMVDVAGRADDFRSRGSSAILHGPTDRIRPSCTGTLNRSFGWPYQAHVAADLCPPGHLCGFADPELNDSFSLLSPNRRVIDNLAVDNLLVPPQCAHHYPNKARPQCRQGVHCYWCRFAGPQFGYRLCHVTASRQLFFKIFSG